MTGYLYILRCADGSYDIGTTVSSMEKRLAAHQAGAYDGYTVLRRPVELVFHQRFERLDDAAAAERQVKGWRRDKKEALIRGRFRRVAGAGAPRRESAASFETRP